MTIDIWNGLLLLALIGAVSFAAGWAARGYRVNDLLRLVRQHFCHMCHRPIKKDASVWNIREEYMHVCSLCHPHFKARFLDSANAALPDADSADHQTFNSPSNSPPNSPSVTDI